MPLNQELVFYTTASGRCQVKEFLDGLDSVPREMGKSLIEDLVTGNIQRKPKATAHLEDSIWELRWSFRGRAYRVTYCAERGKVVLLWGFEKKTQKTPKNVITQSKSRRNEWRKDNG
jgi:phage-related protein